MMRKKIKFKSFVGECTVGGKRALLMKPTTYMNNSGQAVVEAMNFYKIKPENVIVIFDDVSLPVGNKEASISVAGDVIPLFTEFPSATISVEGCEPSECTIFVTDSKGEVVYGRLPVEDDRMELRTGHADGHLTVTVEKEGKTLSSASYFLVPDFSCSYSGKGDIPEDTNMEFTLFGQEYSKDIYDDDLEGPYYHGDDAFNVLWSVPVVTYDLGEGPKPYEQLVLNADELRSSMLVVKVRGAKKKKMYFGPESGKKEDISKDWDTDSIHINLPPLLDQVYASTKSYCFFPQQEVHNSPQPREHQGHRRWRQGSRRGRREQVRIRLPHVPSGQELCRYSSRRGDQRGEDPR